MAAVSEGDASPDNKTGLEDTHDLVIFCIGSGLMAVHVAMFLRKAIRLCSFDWRRQLPSVVLSRISSFFRKLVSVIVMEKEDDPCSAEVERLVAARRLKLAEYLYNVACWCWVCVEMSILANLATGTPRFLTNGLDVLAHCVFCVFTVIKVRPRLLNCDTLDFWYSVFMTMSIVSATPLFVYKEALPTLSKSIAAIQLLGGFTVLNIPLILFWNCVYLIVVGVSYHFGHTDCQWMPYTSTFVSGELISVLNMVFMLNGMKNAMRMQARQEIEAKTARSETSAVTALLSTMGDAVVELDRDLRIKRDCPQLATMLFQGHDRCLTGTPFEHLLAGEDDARLFQEYMAAKEDAASDRTLANVFHVNVRDTLNNHVRIEIFHVCKTEPGIDQDDHLLGIREDTEFENEDGIKAMGPFPTPGDVHMSAEDPEVTVTVDALSFEVREYSQAFLALCGQRPTSDVFSEWIASQNRKAFMKHFTTKISKWMVAPSTVGPVVYKNMHMSVPLGAHSSFRFQTQCTMILTQQATNADRPGEKIAVAQAAFREVQTQGVRGQSRRRRRSEDGESSADSDTSRRSASSRPKTGSLAGSRAVDGDVAGRQSL